MFVFTESFADNLSSAVDYAAWSEPRRELLVVVTGGSGYVYKNIDRNVWNEFKNASSRGRYYSTVIKRSYGPGSYEGYDPDTEAEKTDSKSLVDDKVLGGTGGYLNAGPFIWKTTLTDTAVSGHSLTYASPGLSKFEVGFTIAEGDEKTYPTTAESVEAALAKLRDVAGSLGVEVNVKWVKHYFA